MLHARVRHQCLPAGVARLLRRPFDPGKEDDFPIFGLPLDGGSNGKQRIKDQQIAGGYTRVINANQLLDVRLGFSRTVAGKYSLSIGTNPGFTFPGLPTDPTVAGGIPSISITGFTGLGRQGTNPQFQNPDVLNPKANYTKIIGRHSLKTGYEYQAINTEIDDFAPKYGTDNYSGRFSQVPGTPNNNVQFLADFLFGARSHYELATPAIVHYQQRMHFFYAQDDFKITPKLTLNIGVRYEYATPQYERDSLCVALPAYGDRPHADYYAAVTELFDRVGGRPHWASAHDKTVSDLAPLYPRYDDFCRLRSELDPHGLFLNPHLARLFGAQLR